MEELQTLPGRDFARVAAGRRCATRPRLTRFAALALLAAVALTPAGARAQFGREIPESHELVQIKIAPVRIPAGGSATAMVMLQVMNGWHINANPAANENAIPTEIEFTTAHGIRAAGVRYPEPKIQKLSFDPEPLLVFDGATTVPVTLRAAAGAALGTFRLSGKVLFQACDDAICLPPASVPFDMEVEVVAAGEAGSGGNATPPDSAGGGAPGVGAPGTGTADPGATDVLTSGTFATGPPSDVGGAAGRRLDEALAKGGVWWFLWLFVGGILLNLTPCVFPMLGVTLSIFGARRKEPLPRVITNATLYVLGIAVMYSSLGVVAALTGGLFGAALQNVWVNVGLGVLMIVLSLSMFGLYEMQPPPWLMNKLGGATSASFAGTFMAGLGVGVIAAPCIGPFVVAVLALIAQRQDPLFGFQTMFTLSLGLGIPYLVLGTFSNLLQKLPRSGDWMVWVKGVFGVILVGVGAFYIMLALAPRLAPSVVPVVMVLGGIYLGWFERTRGRGPGFLVLKRVFGTLAAVAGLFMVLTTPTRSIEFRPADEAVLRQAIASGRPVILEFSADWCVPCHELERTTFSDRAVIAASREFHTLKVDLTRYDSPESEAWRKNWNVPGVPAVIFIGADGAEIPGLRVVGFIAPKPFLELMKRAAGGTGAARE
ncbi:MAG: cytochrome c biogenesis protein CcdA [Candidatus Eisenbacteria bacterium]